MKNKKSETPPELMDIRGVAKFFGVSTRHIHNLHVAGKMPGPVKIGALNRWSRTELLQWFDAGAPLRGDWLKIKKDKVKR